MRILGSYQEGERHRKHNVTFGEILGGVESTPSQSHPLHHGSVGLCPCDQGDDGGISFALPHFQTSEL